jgi:hypothetical protein
MEPATTDDDQPRSIPKSRFYGGGWVELLRLYSNRQKLPKRLRDARTEAFEQRGSSPSPYGNASTGSTAR